MSNYSKWNAKQDPRTELHDVLGLTGAEISINNLPAGVGVPFVHSHKKNEEIYIILGKEPPCWMVRRWSSLLVTSSRWHRRQSVSSARHPIPR